MRIDRAAVEAAARAVLGGRYDQAAPTFTSTELERIRRFGTVKRYADGELLFEAGKPRPGMFVVLSGHIVLTTRDGLGHVTPAFVQGPGQFIGEVSILANNIGSPLDGHADGELEALLLPPENLRALIVEEAELGERLMRAMILRRVALIEFAEGGALVIGSASSRDVARLEDFLRRNAQPHRLLDPAVDEAARDVVAHAHMQLPLVVCPSGAVLQNPSESALARALGTFADRFARSEYDVAIVGCGPAGLAAAVYAASEGLNVVVLETHAFGGQAGASSRIENYLGFPTGITGQALMGRAFVQAEKFGAEVVIPVAVRSLDCSRSDGLLAVVVDDGRRVRARAIVIATGARYRRPPIQNLADFEGRGVWYWASPFEATKCNDQEIILIGGGNSAGQAAVFLARHAKKVLMMVRGPALAASMSRYLVDRIGATSNIEVLTGTSVTALEGDNDGLHSVRWRSHGTEQVSRVSNLFVFIGADPVTEWLRDCGVALDPHGFVITSQLESSVRGVFAIGDVRAGSVKRVGAAIGEGSQVVPALHAFLEPDVESRRV